jgi:hypothetical protein
MIIKTEDQKVLLFSGLQNNYENYFYCLDRTWKL